MAQASRHEQTYTTTVQVQGIEDYSRRRQPWFAVWAKPLTSTYPQHTCWSFYSDDPTVADTARQAQIAQVPLLVEWRDDGIWQRIVGCEEAR